MTQPLLRSITKFLCLLPLSLTWIGCEADSTQSTADSSPPSSPTATSPVTADKADSQAEAANPAPPKSANNIALPAEKPLSTSAVDKVGNSTSTKPTSTPAAATSDWKKPEAQPTAEQLAAWTQPEYTPMVLLAAKESDKVGLVLRTARTLDGKFYVLAGYKLTLWSVAGTEPEHVFYQVSEPAQDKFIRAIAISPDGKLLAAGDAEGFVRLWSLENRTELIAKKLQDNDVIDVSFSPDSQSLATLSFDNEVFIWSTETLAAKSKWKSKTNSVRRVAFVTNEKAIVLGEKTEVWKVADGSFDRELAGDRYNNTLGYTDDRQALVLGNESALCVWKETDPQPRSLVDSEFANTELVALAPGKKSIATANGRTIRIWDLVSKRCVQVIDVAGAAIVGLEWLPESNLLVAIPEMGPVRVWGTPAAGASAGLKPLHKPTSPLQPSDKDVAQPNQIADAIDLRIFPQPPGLTVSTISTTTLNGETSLSADDAKLFYRYQLGQRGWMELTGPTANPMAVEFRKDGSMLSASFYGSGGGKTYVSVNHAGNFDLRQLPRLGTIETQDLYSSEHSVMYRTKADLLSIETTLLREMHKAGWTAYSRLHASHNEEFDKRDLTFLRGYIDLHISIQKQPDTPDQFTISYNRFVNLNAIPIPDDAGYVEFEGAVEPYLVATTSMSLDDAQAFYDRQLDSQGWLRLSLGRTLKEEYRYLPFLQNQRDLSVYLSKMKNGRTLVRIGEDLERSSWQLAQAKPDDAKAKSKSTEDAGLQAADFPILAGAQEVKYDRSGKTIDFQAAGVPLAALAEQYTQAMAELGWIAEKGGIRSDDYTFFNFEKDKKEIAFRANGSQGNARVNIQGDGLLWTKELPDGKKIISYELWLRDNKHPASLDLLDRYINEMNALSKP